MQELQTFNNLELGDVRVLNRDGNPWFVAADVCKALEISNSRDAIARLDDDEKAAVGLTDTSSNGVTQKREMSVVNEPGLYTLVLGSRKPQAKAFKRWITHEVIPAIRRTGAYGTPGAIEHLLTELIDRQGQMLNAMEAMLVRIGQSATGSNPVTKTAAHAVRPEQEYRFAEGDLITIEEAARVLMINRVDLVNFLYYKRMLYRTSNNRYQPYKKANDGLFVVELTPSRRLAGYVNGKTYITPKGLSVIRDMLDQEKGDFQ